MSFPSAASASHSIIFTAGSLSLPEATITDSVVLLGPGDLSAADLWFEGPSAWLDADADVTIRLFGILNGIRFPVAETVLRSAPTRTANGVVSGVILSSRETRVEAFEVSLSRTDRGPALSGGRVALSAWSEASATPLLAPSFSAASAAFSADERPRSANPTSTTFRAAGIVIDRDSGRGLAGLRVEAIPSDRPQGDLLCVALTDAEGRFAMSVTEDDVDLAETACFRVTNDDDGLLLLDTAGTIRWSLGAQNAFFRLSVAPERPLSRTISPPRFVIRGRLFGAEGPIAGHTIQAFDRQLDGYHALGESTTTDSRGWYELRYGPADLDLDKLAPDLVVRAFEDDEQQVLVAESPERCGAPPTVRVDLVVTGERYLGRTTYETARPKVLSRLGARTLASVTSEERELIACSCGAALDDVHALVDAALLVASSPALDEEVTFALLRRGFGASRDAFFAHNARTVRSELSAALDANLLSQKHHRDFDAALQVWIVAAASFALEARSGRAGLAELCTVADITAGADRTLIAEKLVGHEGTIESFWTNLDVSQPRKEQLQLTFRWATLARGHLPLIQYLESRRVANDPVDLQSLAAKDESDWLTILETVFGGSAVSAPADIPGADTTAKRANFARVLATTLATAFPMQAFVGRVHKHEVQEIKTFFSNHSSFEFLSGRLSQLTLSAPTLGLSPENERRVRAMERLFSVIPYYEPVKALLDLGIESASAIETMGKKAFLDKCGESLGTAVAEGIFKNASWVASAASALHSKYSPTVHQGIMHVLPDWVHPSSSQDPDANPDWSLLFGSAGGCQCKHCRSVLGPAAYLVDLLEFLGRYPSSNEKGDGSFWTARDVLLGKVDGEETFIGRRPDIALLSLDCANAEKPLPYIDLVNEILEVAVAHDSMPSTTEWQSPESIATSAAASELLAGAEIVYPQEHHQAWIALRDAVYPFTLPRDFWAESTRLHLGHLGVSRAEILEKLGSDPGTYDDLLARERLGTTARGWQILVGTEIPDVSLSTLWGSPDAEVDFITHLRSVPTFLARAGITFEELQELLHTRFVNGLDGEGTPGLAKLAVSPAGSCDLAQMTIPLLAGGHLARIHPFLRLRLLAGLSITELDRALAAFGATAIDAETLHEVTAALDLGRRLGIEPPALWSLWGPLDTFEGTGPSPYRAAFLDRMVGNQGASAFHDLLTTSSSDPLALHGPSLALALSISARDLALLTDKDVLAETLALPPSALAVSGEPPLLSLENLSGLFRAVVLARALRLPIGDFVALRALLGSSGGIFASPPATRDFIDTVDAWRKAGLSVAAAQYVLRDVGGESAAPTRVALDNLLAEIRASVSVLVQQTGTLEDPDGAKVLAALAGKGISVGEAKELVEILAGLSGLTLSDQRSKVQGHLELVSVFEEPIDAVLDQLCPADPVGLDPNPVPPQLASPAERFAYVARRLERSIVASQLVVERLAAEMNVDITVARHVVESVLRSPAADRSALADFLPAVGLSTSPPADDDYRTTLRAALKHGRLLHALRLTAALPAVDDIGDLAWAYPASPSEVGLHDLPMTAPDPVPNDYDLAQARTRFGQWLSLAQRTALRDRLAGGRDALRQILEQVPAQDPALAPETAIAFLAERTGWDTALLTGFADSLDYSTPALLETSLHRLETAVRLATRLGASAAQTLAWLDLDAAPPAAFDTPPAVPPAAPNALDLALAARRLAKARYDQPGWEKIARGLLDPFRAAERDALTAYLVPRRHASKDALFASLLIDVEMCPCLLTSRIVEATNAVQVFVQRSLLRLEPIVSLDDAAAREWEWRKAYRVWEANRKVFLYPENWIEPELRDGQTPLFKTALTKLRQGELTSESAEVVFRDYLEGLFEIGRLEVKALLQDPDTKTDHVLARTRSAPHRWFYRTRSATGTWTAWETASLDIDSDHVVLVWAERRLHAVWPLFTTKPEEKQVDGDEAVQRFEVRLAWCAYSQGKWGSKRLSEESLRAKPALVEGATFGVPKRAFSLIPDEQLQVSDNIPPRLALIAEVNSLKKAASFYASPPIIVGHFTFDPCAGGQWRANQALMASGAKRIDLLAALSEDSSPNMWADLNEPMKTRMFQNQFLEGNTDALVVRRKDQGSPSIDAYPLFGTTPGSFRVVSPARPPWGTPRFLFQRFVYGDDRRVFFADLRTTKTIEWSTASKAHPGMMSPLYPHSQAHLRASDAIAEWAEQAVTLIPHENTFRKYHVALLYHPFVCDFARRLASGGVDGLLGWKTDSSDSVQFLSTSQSLGTSIASVYEPNGENVETPFPEEQVDFSATGAYSAYNWELFFHLPSTIALALRKEQRFAEAQKWFHYIFDPTTGGADTGPRRYWKVRPFYENHDLATIQEQLAQLSADSMVADEVGKALDPAGADTSDITAQIEAWRSDPFDPHTIAKMRILAYQKWVVMQYLQNLFDWADSLFRQDTMESLHEALQLYLLAAGILGPRPTIVDHGENADSKVYTQLASSLDPFGNAVTSVEPLAPPAPSDFDGEAAPSKVAFHLYFCVPHNERLLGLWDLLADRLFKLRNCMNIEGIVRDVALFAPPIDPALLVRATAAGVRLDKVLSDLAAPAPLYRFLRLHAKAVEFASVVQSLGSMLLSALEKNDGETVSVLRTEHENGLLRAELAIREDAIRESKETVEGLRRSRKVVERREEFYRTIRERLPEERDSQFANEVAQGFLGAAGVADAAAAIAHAIPNVTVKVPPPGVDTQTGGSYAGNVATALARVASAAGSASSLVSNALQTEAGYIRRRDEWRLQADLAKKELASIDKQIAASEIRVAVAENELSNLKLRIDQNREVADHLHTKFTNTDLYTWMSTELSAEHYRAYSLAYDLAKRAERAFQLERANPNLSFISFGYWDSLKKGLLSGERLLRDLRIMEAAYMTDARRDLEITKHVSLASLDASKLVELRDSGETTFTIPEVEFDADYPGHYLRRVKTVALTVPVTTPPEEGVRAELTLLNSTFRRTALLTGGNYAAVGGEDSRFVTDPRAHMGLVTSTGQSDPGLFEVNLHDEMLLPFEGAGADSTWRISIPKETNAFPLHEISDVVLHLRYTAKDGGAGLKAKARAEVSAKLGSGTRTVTRIFDVKSELPDAWERFMRGNGEEGTDLAQEIEIPFTTEHTKRLFGGVDLRVTKVTVSATFAAKYAPPPPMSGEVLNELTLPFKLVNPSETESDHDLPFQQGEPFVSEGAEGAPLNVPVPVKGAPASSWKLVFEGPFADIPEDAIQGGLLRGDLFERLFVVFHYTQGAS